MRMVGGSEEQSRRTGTYKVGRGLWQNGATHAGVVTEPDTRRDLSAGNGGEAFGATRRRTIATSHTFMERAACRDAPHNPYFAENPPAAMTAEQRALYGEAKAVCAGCPVADKCLDYAISINNKQGLWGGMTTAERIKEKARRKKEAAA